jgi:hypothetical protein
LRTVWAQDLNLLKLNHRLDNDRHRVAGISAHLAKEFFFLPREHGVMHIDHDGCL